MTMKARGLVAGGDTPTAEALIAAADDLQVAGYSKGTIFLVSDGESTCDDPCAAARTLSRRGIDVTVVGVAFQLSPKGYGCGYFRTTAQRPSG